MTQTITGPFYT